MNSRLRCRARHLVSDGPPHRQPPAQCSDRHPEPSTPSCRLRTARQGARGPRRQPGPGPPRAGAEHGSRSSLRGAAGSPHCRDLRGRPTASSSLCTLLVRLLTPDSGFVIFCYSIRDCNPQIDGYLSPRSHVTPPCQPSSPRAAGLHAAALVPRLPGPRPGLLSTYPGSCVSAEWAGLRPRGAAVQRTGGHQEPSAAPGATQEMLQRWWPRPRGGDRHRSPRPTLPSAPAESDQTRCSAVLMYSIFQKERHDFNIT